MRALLTVVVLVALLWLFVRLVESRLAFFPSGGEQDTPASIGITFESLTLPTSDGERLRAWWLPHDAAAATVVFFHGNGGNLSLWSDAIVGIHRRGFAVLAVDYRGYGVSTGRPSERGMYRDVDATVAAARERAHPDAPVIYWGRSLGTVAAAYGATVSRPDGLVLEAGFPDARSVVSGSPILWGLLYFSTYRFPTREWLARVDCPVLFLHGDADSVIPYRHGRALHDGYAGPKRFVTIPGGDHNDLEPEDPAPYWAAVTGFAESLKKPREMAR